MGNMKCLHNFCVKICQETTTVVHPLNASGKCLDWHALTLLVPYQAPIDFLNLQQFRENLRNCNTEQILLFKSLQKHIKPKEIKCY